MRKFPILLLCKWFAEFKLRGVRVGVFCEDYPALNGRHISRLNDEVEGYPAFLGDYISSRHEFVLKPEYGSGVVFFGNLDEVSKYDSEQFAAIFVDEVNRNPEPVFRLLRSRLRWPQLPASEWHFMGSTNPGGEPWVRQFFVDRQFPPAEKEADKFHFVPFLPKDNTYLAQDYLDTLASLPEHERRAFLEGDWTAFDSLMSEEGYRPLLSANQVNPSIVAAPPSTVFRNPVVGVDPGGGGDETAIVVRDDFSAQVLFCGKTKDPLIVIPLILDFVRKNDVKHIVVDKTGLGWAFTTRLKEVCSQSFNDVRIHGIGFGETSSDKTKYKNLKVELFWRLRSWIMEKGGQLVEYKTSPWGQLSLIRWRVQSDDKFIELESKADLRARGIDSPNVSDALAASFYIRPDPADASKMIYRSKAVQSAYRYNSQRTAKVL